MRGYALLEKQCRRKKFERPFAFVLPFSSDERDRVFCVQRLYVSRLALRQNTAYAYCLSFANTLGLINRASGELS